MVRGWLRRRDHHQSSNKTTTANTNTNFNVRFFSYDTLRIATNNFSALIGRGGYGSVFKGVLPDDGLTVAVKTINGPDQHRLLAMVELMSNLRHVNLIQVVGCCVDKQLILVCKYADKGTVDQLLHTKKSCAFNWERRAAVCIGIARGLSYLHEEIDPRVIHCDIKPSNIILDSNFVPKIGDFDLLELVDGFCYVKGGDYTIKGTQGYMDPNYISTGQLTEKVDVYSFGVTMLEIITGRRVVDTSVKETGDQMIISWVERMRKEGRVFDIFDQTLTDVTKEDVERYINVALLCTQAAPEERPSMVRVVNMLYGGHKSDQEISEMAAAAVVAQPAAEWFSGSSTPTSVSMSSSLTMSTSGKLDNTDGSTSRGMKEDASHSSGNFLSNGARSVVSSASSKEEDVVKAYFERSMEKIMRFQATVHSASNRAMTSTQTTVIDKSSQRVSMEAVYPPFQSGEYTRRPSQL